MSDMKKNILEMKNISKTFPGTKALDNVDFELREGEILSLVGANGAGKSTLIKIICGVYQHDKDHGEMLLDGRKVEFTEPKAAIDAGISTIHQELSYHKHMTVAENIFIGAQPMKGSLVKRVDWKKLFEDAAPFIREVGLSCEPSAIMGTLSVADKQLVEIAKSLARKAKIIVFDEPTSSIGIEETKMLLDIIRQLARKGVSIIYISHRLSEVTAISDRVIVMRDGKRSAELSGEDITEDNIVKNMIGRAVTNMYPQFNYAQDNVAIEVRNLNTGYLKDINFKAYKGEVLGLFGMAGSGRTQTFDAICGAIERKSGDFLVYDKNAPIKSPSDAIKHGISYLTADRKQNGLILRHSVSRNVILASLPEIVKRGLVNEKKEISIAKSWIQKLGIKCRDYAVAVGSLSGGNQQKVVIAKCLECKPKVLLLNEPTRGVDIGAKAEIYQEIQKLCGEGLCIVMIASELSEVMGMSDRILTFANGRITGEFMKDEFVEEKLMTAAIPKGA